MRHLSISALLALFVLSLLNPGCAPTNPTGASFKALAPPDSQDTLIYVYRDDSLRGVDGVDIELDGEKLGRLLNGEYLAFLVDPGQHELKARMKWLQVIPRSWNSLDFTSRAGQTLYLRVWAAYEATPSRGIEAANPASPSGQNGQVGLFMGIQKPDIGRKELKTTRRAAGR